MTLVPTTEQPPVVDRFTVMASANRPTADSQGIRSPEVEQNWLPYLGPCALLLARKCDYLLSNLQDGQTSIAVLVNRWAEALGCFPEEVLGAKNRLLRFGLAVWEEKGNVMQLHRYWPPVPAAIATPEHRALLLAVPDLPEAPRYVPDEAAL